MSSKNNSQVISKASPHTVKKFELIETYIKSWAQKLMLNTTVMELSLLIVCVIAVCIEVL